MYRVLLCHRRILLFRMYTSIVTESKINENPLDRLHNQLNPGVHNRSGDDSEFVINNVICEAAGCFAEAIVQIGVKAGQLGRIRLSLCKNCVNKFVGDD